MKLDSFQWAFVAAVARAEGNKEAEKMAMRESDKALRREAAEKMAFADRLYGRKQ